MVEVQRRRRGAVLEQAIVDAAWTELDEVGWDRFSIAGVAVRCGTAKTVIYRRWPDRVQLAQDMLVRALRRIDNGGESLGDLRSDLLQFLTGLGEFYAGPFGQAVRGVLLERAERTSSFVGPEVPTAVSSLVEAAVGRGELTLTPPPIIQNLGHTLMTAELVHTAEPLEAAAIEAVVDDVWLPALLRRGHA